MNLNCAAKERKRLTAFIDFLIIGILGSALYLIAVQTEAHLIIDQWAEGRRFLGLELDEAFVIFAFLGIAFSVFSLRRWNELSHEISERKRLQKALEEEIAKTQNYLNIAGVMFVAIDKEQKIFLMNDKGCKILGYDKSEIIGKNWFDTFLPERIKHDVKAVFIKLIAGDVSPVEYFENPVLTKSGEERIIAWHNMILRDERGKITGTLSSGEDITERKYAEDVLMESEERFHSVAQSATDAIISIDSSGVIVFWNTSAERLFDYPVEEAIDKSLTIIMPHQFREAHQKGLSRLTSTGESSLIGKTIEIVGLKKDGSEFPIELTLSTWKTNKGTFFTAIVRDITSRKQAEQMLLESEEKFRNLAEQSLVGIYLVQDEKFRYVNPVLAEIFGYAVEELIDKKQTVDLVLPEDLPVVRENVRRRESGEVQSIHYDFRGRKKNGEIIYVDVYGSKTLYQGRPAVIGTLLDITGRKHAEDRIMRQSREIESRNVELSTLYKISSAISCTININDLFSNILNTITEIDIMKVERRGGILLIDGDKMNLVSHLGHPAAFLDMHKNMTVNDCLCGLAARTGEMIISKNSHTDCHHTINYPGMTPHGHIIIPLKVIDKIIGVLYLYLPVDFDIDERTIQTFIAIGNQIGIAINNCLLHEKAKMLSLYDPLTKVANRNLMNVELEKNFARSKRFKSPFSIIMTDLDNFKAYNDTYGHTYGDRLLVKVAKILSTKVRTVDLVARYGGEEFLIILPDTELKGACEVAERIRKSVEAMTAVTLSLGVISYSSEILNMEAFIKQEDDALYRAKQKGKNRVEVSNTGMKVG
ncbi:MAG: PAS domain S-box protein [Nitrospirae bacterium]|nr:PAS domain S-box protein [Nitrospirota bacterium]